MLLWHHDEFPVIETKIWENILTLGQVLILAQLILISDDLEVCTNHL